MLLWYTYMKIMYIFYWQMGFFLLGRKYKRDPVPAYYSVFVIKVSKIQIEFMKSSFLPSGFLPCILDTVQDFLIKLGIKPHLQLLKIGIFSLNHVIVRPTKIMNNLLKVCKICAFKVIFWHQKPTESFWIFFSLKNIWLID